MFDYITAVFGSKKRKIEDRVADLERLAGIHNQKLGALMSDLDQVKADVDAIRDAVGALVAKIGDLQAQLAALLNGQLPAETQAKVDAIFEELEQVKAQAQATVAPPAPPSDGG